MADSEGVRYFQHLAMRGSRRQADMALARLISDLTAAPDEVVGQLCRTYGDGLLSSPSSGDGDGAAAEAQRVVVYGATPLGCRADKLGHGGFVRAGSQRFNGRPVYTAGTSGDSRMLWHTGAAWTIGPAASVDWSRPRLVAEDMAQAPERITAQWQVRLGHQRWPAPDVRCDSLGEPCLFISGTVPGGHHEDKLGQFRRLEHHELNGRPVYMSCSDDTCLLCYTSQHWMLGLASDFGIPCGFLVVQDPAEAPEQIAATWEVADGEGGSVLAPGVKCLAGVQQSVAKCIVCLEQAPVLRLPCAHRMCRGCLAELFSRASVDESLLPVRCCQTELGLQLATEVLSQAQLDAFLAKVEERSARDKMYCPVPRCSAFINLDRVDWSRPLQLCRTCGAALCIRCRTAWHEGMDCEEHAKRAWDREVAEITALAAQQGWRPCPGCRIMVELKDGCNHITCRCSFQFCYKCGKQWRTCSCPLFEHDHAVQEEERRVQAREGALGRAIARRERIRLRQAIQRYECPVHDFMRYSLAAGVQRPCRNCGFLLRHYCFYCRRCDWEVCRTCRFNRL